MTPGTGPKGPLPPAAPPGEGEATQSIAGRQVGPADTGSFVQTVISLGASAPEPAPAPAPARVDAFEDASPKQLDLTGRMIGGYKVTAMLGAGGMGAVCLAHQVSLDRDVALKILPAKMARNPDFLMRFTREALSAARMTHHNIIQIYDIGNDANIHYISMEFVRGRTLGQIMRDEGQLPPATAAGYILQAARGLQYAHRRGIIHRDIKPDNLMINEHGILKIADMGLAKMLSEAKRVEAGVSLLDANAEALKNATGDLTMGDIAMGTPSYMPPEQARDASSVDHRADQYSLGCTFYALLTGQAPFTGTSAYDLIHQHLLEDAPAVENLAPDTPPAVSRIVARMLLKDPDERYPDMGAVIQDIEDYMGVEAGRGARIPNQGHVKFLEDAQADYYGVAAGRRRKLALIAFGAGVPALALVFYSLAFFLSPGSDAAGVAISWALGTMLLTPICKFLHEGMREKTYLFRRVKSFITGMSWKEWLGALGALLLVVFIIGPITFVASLICGFGLALAYESFVKKPVRAQRAHPVEEINRLLKELRILGLGENALQSFVAGFSGDDWEEFYEELFGYEAMIAARERIQQSNQGKPRKTTGMWRDPLLRTLNRIEDNRKARREKSRISDLEVKRLEAEGMGGTEARRQADEMASMLVNRAMWAEHEVTPTPLPAPRADRSAGRDNAPIKQAAPKNAAPLPARRRRSEFRADQLLRAVVGLALCLLYAMPAGMKTGMLPAALFKGSLALSPIGLVAGVMLMTSALSKSKGYGMTLLVGAALFTFHVPLQAMVPKGLEQLDPLGVGIILMALGFLPPWFGKLTGKPY